MQDRPALQHRRPRKARPDRVGIGGVTKLPDKDRVQTGLINDLLIPRQRKRAIASVTARHHNIL